MHLNSSYSTDNDNGLFVHFLKKNNTVLNKHRINFKIN